MTLEKAPKLAIGIDLGGTTTSLAAVDVSGMVLAQEHFPTPVELEPAAALSQIASQVRQLDETVGGGDEFHYVGIGSPGPLDLETGTIVTTPNLGWNDIPVRGLLEKELGLPVVVDNDAVAATYAEWWVGAGKPFESIVGITLGTGVGGGIILSGEILRGRRGMGGHIGHMVVEGRGRRCGCGNRGCLEAYVSAPGIINLTREILGEDADSVLASEQTLSPEVVSRAAVAGDQAAIKIFKKTAFYLAAALTSLSNVIDPDAFVVGGAVAEAGPVLFEPLQGEVESMSFKGARAACPVLPAALGNLSGAVGAAGLALKRHEPR